MNATIIYFITSNDVKDSHAVGNSTSLDDRRASRLAPSYPGSYFPGSHGGPISPAPAAFPGMVHRGKAIGSYPTYPTSQSIPAAEAPRATRGSGSGVSMLVTQTVVVYHEDGDGDDEGYGMHPLAYDRESVGRGDEDFEEKGGSGLFHAV